MNHSIEWVNEYTARIETQKKYENGDVIKISSHQNQTKNKTLWQHFLNILKNKFTNNQQSQIKATIIKAHPQTNTYIAEVNKSNYKHHTGKPIRVRVREK